MLVFGLSAHHSESSVAQYWCHIYECKKHFACTPRKVLLWIETPSFLALLLQIRSYWLTPLSQTCASKWYGLSVLSRCLSLCTVNAVSDSWLCLKLWGHYILTGSLFTLHLPPISSLLSLPLWVYPSVSLGVILSLDAYIKRFCGKHTATGHCLLLNLQNVLQMNTLGKETRTQSFLWSKILLIYCPFKLSHKS